jgi:DUF2934 family protein
MHWQTMQEAPSMSAPNEDQIRTRARQLWEIAGRPEGRHEEFWHEAERQLKVSWATSATDNPDETSPTFTE